MTLINGNEGPTKNPYHHVLVQLLALLVVLSSHYDFTQKCKNNIDKKGILIIIIIHFILYLLRLSLLLYTSHSYPIHCLLFCSVRFFSSAVTFASVFTNVVINISFAKYTKISILYILNFFASTLKFAVMITRIRDEENSRFKLY